MATVDETDYFLWMGSEIQFLGFSSDEAVLTPSVSIEVHDPSGWSTPSSIQPSWTFPCEEQFHLTEASVMESVVETISNFLYKRILVIEPRNEFKEYCVKNLHTDLRQERVSFAKTTVMSLYKGTCRDSVLAAFNALPRNELGVLCCVGEISDVVDFHEVECIVYIRDGLHGRFVRFVDTIEWVD